MTDITVTLDTIPNWLEMTPLAISCRNGDPFKVPAQYFMTDDELNTLDISTDKDRIRILHIMQYWGEQTNVPWPIFDLLDRMSDKQTHRNSCNWTQLASKYTEMAEVIEIMRTIQCYGQSILSATVFAKMGNISGLKYLLSRGVLWNTDKYQQPPHMSYSDFCNLTSVPFIPYFPVYHVKDHPSSGVCIAAAYHGQLDCLRYLHTQGCKLDMYVGIYAALNGQLKCLQYFNKSRGPWTTEICAYAARYGRLKCLQYAHEHGCPWDAATCAWAIQSGQLECLQYAYEHDCPHDISEIDLEIHYSIDTIMQLKCLKYAIDHHIPLHQEQITMSLNLLAQIL